MENHHRTMKWHYDVTMEPIMTSEAIITSHKWHSIIVQLGVFLHCDFKIVKDKYNNKYIFISYTLAGNDIKSLNIRI